ncbi:MAG: hypothetical protein ABW168_20700, partial [Sedimenticola sp.]
RMLKIELHRPDRGKPLIFPTDEGVIAVATDSPLEVQTRLPLLDLNNAEEIARFILRWIGWHPSHPLRQSPSG